MSANNGGPAFPAESVPTGDGGRRPALYSGMTLRDYFAARAMAALLVDEQVRAVVQRNLEGTNLDGAEVIALMAYMQADAMLKAREAK